MGARGASGKQVPRCARNDRQKGKSKSKGKSNGNSNGKSKSKSKSNGNGNGKSNGKSKGNSDAMDGGGCGTVGEVVWGGGGS